MRVRLRDRFWRAWQNVVARESLPHQAEMLEQTGRVDNLRKVAAGDRAFHQGRVYDDSDVYKWLEAVAYQYDHTTDEVRAKFAEVVSLIEKAQSSDGYLHTWVQSEHQDERWRCLAGWHEMYCAGHLIEAGVADFETNGRRNLLEAGERFARCILTEFGGDDSLGYCGHPEIELALARLSKHYTRSGYANLARLMLDRRGNRPSPFEDEIMGSPGCDSAPLRRLFVDEDGEYSGAYAQDHAPISCHDEPLGHAVRAMYLYCGVTDTNKLGAKNLNATRKVWDRMVERKMYVTGAIGSVGSHEGFGPDYELPNRNSYAETCAAIGVAMLGKRLSDKYDDATPMDVCETALYNAVLSGISLDGRRYSYSNPLAHFGEAKRSPWFDCACCPPNIARMIGSIERYAASELSGGFRLNLPLAGSYEVQIFEELVKFDVSSNYPWEGEVHIEVLPDAPLDFLLQVRIPSWSNGYQVTLNGSANISSSVEQHYLTIARTWHRGDLLSIDFKMPTRLMKSNARVVENIDRACVVRGPLVYCLESDSSTGADEFIVEGGSIDLQQAKNDQVGIEIVSTGRRIVADEPVKSPYSTTASYSTEKAEVTLKPYFSWGNGKAKSMATWLRYRP